MRACRTWPAAGLLVLMALGLCQARDTPADSSFADWLFHHGLYAQAETEYLRIRWQSGDRADRDSARLHALLCLQRLGRLAELLERTRLDPAETERGQAALALQVGLACMDSLRLSQAAEELQKASQVPEFREAAGFHLGRALACQRKGPAALATWAALPTASPFRDRADQLADLLMTTPPPRQRSPALAGTLAIAPGLGYAYAGHPQTALSALLLIGLFGWTTEHSFKADNPGLGAFCAFVTLGWYAGSIFGSVQATQRFNEDELQRYQQHFN